MRLLRTKLSRWKVGRQYFLLYCLFFMANIVLSKSNDEFCVSTCSCRKQFGIVNCSASNLQDLPKDIPMWTKKLILDDNRLTSSELSLYDFTKLELLEELSLDWNRITNLSLNFSGNPLLWKISASHCSLTSVPRLIGAVNVTSLNLSHNSINDLNVTELPDLVSLDVSFNKIRSLKEEDFLTLSRLKHLRLQKNKVSQLTWKVFSGLTSIESLDLSRNRIRLIELGQSLRTEKEDLCGDILWTLQHLNLSHNQLSDIKSLTFSGMRSLTSLRLDHNHISVLHDGAFYGPGAMTTLILDHNFITSTSKGWLFSQTSLDTLSVSFNNLTGLEAGGWEYCLKLQHLNLSHNGLSSMKSGSFKELQDLVSLDLSFNRVSQLDDRAFQGLGRLRTLDLSNNEISSSVEDIDGGFLGLNSIQTLSLRNNRIRTLSASALEGINSVVTLDFCGNDVTSIHNHTFDKMTSLKTLSIVSSSFLCDCQLAWFPKWLRDMNESREAFIYNIEGTCFHPTALQGRDILNISDVEFVCVDNPMPILLQEPTDTTSLKGENITFQCRASAMFTESHNATLSPPSSLLTTTPNPPDATPRNPLKESKDRQGRNSFMGNHLLHDSESRKTIGDAPVKPTEPRRSGDFPLKADETRTPTEKRRKTHRRRDATNRPTNGMNVMWKRDGEIIEAGSHIDIRQITRRQGGYVYVTSLLVLNGVTSADDGRYNCIIANHYGYAHSKGAELVVNQFPKFSKTPPPLVVVLNGSSPVLHCGATGQPPPQITWQKDGGKDFPAALERRLLRQQSSVPLLESVDYEEPVDKIGDAGMMLKPDRHSSTDGKNDRFTVDGDAPLEFEVVLPKDSGEYECVVESVVGRIVAKSMLIVETAPSFSADLPTHLKSFLGSSVVIQCPATGIPEPTIQWSFNGSPFNMTSQHFLAENDKLLIVADVRMENAGEYSCRVSNKHGEIFHLTTLGVTQDSDETIFTLLQNGDVATWVVASCLAVAVTTCLLVTLLSCVCYRRRLKEKAMSTNTDETDMEPGHLDTNSYSSDGSMRRGHPMFPLGNSVHEARPNATYVHPEYRASSMSNIAQLRVQSPSATPLLPNEPKRSLSTAAILKDATGRPPENVRRYGETHVGSPSTAFAKKAAGADNYVPVVLKTQNSRTTVPTSGHSEKKKSSKSNSKQSTQEKIAKRPPPKMPNGVKSNLHLTGRLGVAGPRLLNKDNLSQNSRNFPHRDRRKVTSQSRHDSTTESSQPLLTHNGDRSNACNISRTDNGTVVT